jgi:hypothetical protein
MDTFVNRTYEPLKFLGRLFWVPLFVRKGTPPVTYTATWEADGEYRWGPTLVVRVPLTHVAIGLGVWLDSDIDSLEDAEAIREQEQEDIAFDVYEAVNGPTDRDKWLEARQEIADMGLDPNEEMEMMQDRGVFEG